MKFLKKPVKWLWAHKLGSLAVIVIAGLAATLGVVATGGNDSAEAGPRTEIVTETVTVPGDVVVDPASLAELFEGEVHADELAFGEEAAVLLANAEQERSSAAHSQETLETVEELTGWLNSADPNAGLVRTRVVEAITQMCGEPEVKVHLQDNQGWLLMVVKPASQVLHTSYVVNDQIVFMDDYREVGENDAYWVPVCMSGANAGKAVPNGMVRADCGNAHDVPKIRIKRPGIPDKPRVEEEPRKCFDEAGNPINRDANNFCGTPFSGPEQQPVQSEPISDPTLNDPTPGYVPGSAENNHAAQEEAEGDPPYTPSPAGEEAPDPGGTPGGTTNPGGDTDPGGDQGVTDPVDPGFGDDPPAEGDPGAP